MTQALAAIDRLRRLAAIAVGEDGEWFSTCVAEYVSAARHGLTLDEAFGIAPASGAEPWWATEARRGRDELLRRAAEMFFMDRPSVHSRATALALAISRYEAAGWLRDRPFKAPPVIYAGRPEAIYFAILKLGGAPSARTIRRVLS
jgi:hypothetical protein